MTAASAAQEAALPGASTVIQGYKVHPTSVATQRQLEVGRSGFDVLLNDMIHAEDERIPVGRFIHPRIQPGMAFVLGRALSGPCCTIAHAVAAVDFVLPALEIVDSRIADNGSPSGVVLGSVPAALTGLELRLVGCNLHQNGRLAAAGAGGTVLGSPMLALVWLANALGSRGDGLEAGHIVMASSITTAGEAHPGDIWTAQFGGLGSVTARFEAEEA